jgi:rhodanese-related sulfurtransferase
MNIRGYDSFDDIMERGMKALSPNAFEAVANETSALILDTREANDFAKGFIPNSINIGIDGNFAPWVGALIPDIKQEILIVADKDREKEVITRLARVGYDHPIAYLDGGFEAWKNEGKEIDTVDRIAADAFEIKLAEKPIIIDVRNANEFNADHVKDAINIPLDYINEHLAEFPKDKAFIIHCAGGYRSMIAASILKSRGWNNFVDVESGFSGITKTSVPVISNVCQKSKN